MDELRVHSVSDISQEFSFYMDGRFARQYLEGHGKDVRNWGSLDLLDLSNTNLLILTGGVRQIPYTSDSIALVEKFLLEGGTVLLMADGKRDALPASILAKHFGVKLSLEKAKKPEGISFYGGSVLDLSSSFDWNVVVSDANHLPLLAWRKIGLGNFLIGSRGLFGRRPDASDPINQDIITPLLLDLVKSKKVNKKKSFRSTTAELSQDVGPLTLEFHKGTKPFAAKILEEYQLARPHLESITGVQPAPGMIKNLLILPTGGGGFSSGARIAIGAFWGNYPEKRYPMVELISHEAGHSWVLPHPEPLWNEPIATYLGIQVGKRLGMPEADETLARALSRGRKYDPDYDAVNPLGEDVPRDLIWGKSYFVFEELERLHGPEVFRKYFQTKRRVLSSDRNSYSFDDCVAVWSIAVGTDLFPWFRGLSFDVHASQTDIGLLSQ